jgi:hypothetical protein
MKCYAHTISSAGRAGLVLAGADEYGVPEWLGNQKQHATFALLESNPDYA